jgi:hypothetical protein
VRLIPELSHEIASLHQYSCGRTPTRLLPAIGGRRRGRAVRAAPLAAEKEIAMDKTKHLESLKDDLFENLTDGDLGRASAGIQLTSANKESSTHVGKVYDEEFQDD